MSQVSLKKNVLLNLIRTFSSIVFPLITFPYIYRVLLPDNVGKIYFSLSVVSYFSLIATLGITTYAVRECSAVRQNREDLSLVSSQIFSVNIITTLVSYLFLVITLFFYHEISNYRTLILIQSIAIIATTIGADWLNVAMEDFKYITLRTVIFQFVSLVLMFAFVHKPDDYIKFAFISLVSSSGSCFSNVLYRRRYCKVNFVFSINWKKHFFSIFYLFVMLLAQTIFNSVDSTMLGLMRGDFDVAIYSSAHKIMDVITQLIVSVAFVLIPRMSYYFSLNDYENINRLSRKVFSFFCLIGLPCIFGATILAKEIILIVAGAEYIEATSVLQILMISYLFNLFGGSFWGNILLLPAKREKFFMIVCCIAAVVNIFSNYFLIPTMGANGAAFTTGICNAMILVILVLGRDRKVKLTKIGKMVITPIIGCMGIYIVCLLFESIQNVFLRTILSITLSSVLYFFIQYIGKNELFGEIFEKACSVIHSSISKLRG